MYQNIFHNAEDTELLLQLSKGNKGAFDILYDKYWKQVFNSAYKRLNDIDYAKDIAQDVFVQLWIRGNKSPIENLPAYLFVVARNSVFKHLEKESRYSAIPDMAQHIEDPLNRADAEVLYDEFLTAFNQLIDQLPTQQRIIFKMRFEEDLSSQQIADILQISPKTVRNQLGKALSTLRASLLMIYLILFFYQGK
ncbi:RNA polymerase sigma factor [Pedobacter sp. L105]|uniref:RNA polymerase sigma factor n=1 Tax=Pedobacter sp. L105 TaxID=1641871 RepID=UPI00131D05E7|nr:sigma-70 family RNA polymerase sigma factor [Pedobacter sp. L105]